MNKQELTNIIRTIVREEVERALPNVLVEILASKVGDREIVAEQQLVPMQRKVQTQQPTQQRQVAQPRVQKQFSTNPILNQILNETQGGVPSDPDMEVAMSEMPSAGGGQVSILDKMRSIPQSQLNENKEVAGVFNVLKRDFRQVVKAIDKKASIISPPPNFKMTPGQFDQE